MKSCSTSSRGHKILQGPPHLLYFFEVKIIEEFYEDFYWDYKSKNLISEKKQNIKLIKAELAYLSRPERLQSIAKQQFNMKEILPSDIWNINDISKLYFEKN